MFQYSEWPEACTLDFAHDPRFTKKTGWGIYGEQPPVALNDQTTEIVGKYNTRTKVFPLD